MRAVDETVRLTTGQAIVKFLQAQWSERDGERRRLIPAMFGIFGHGNVLGLGQALEELGADLPFLQGRNEQSMVHAASAYARATRRRATLACTSSIGPGATNMVTGAASATINRLPVLLLPGDVYATRHQGPVLQQLEHSLAGDVSVNDCFRPVSRFFDRITRPEQLLTALPEAMRVLTSPVETGAVTIALPQDVQSNAYDYPESFFEERAWRIERPLPDSRRLAEALELLRSAERPVVIAGGGVLYSEAESELATFASSLGIPVAETFAGKGAMQEDSWLTLGGVGLEGNPGATRIVKTADLVICVGTRLTDFATGSQSVFQHPEVSFVSINVTGRDAVKQGALPIVADAREALGALREAAAGVETSDGYREEVTRGRDEWLEARRSIAEPVEGEAMSQGELILALNDFVQAGDTVIAAAGTPPGDLLKVWDATGGRNCHLEFGYSCMGYELPAGVGVRMAQEGGEVYVYIGDGTFVLNPGELVTALQEGLKITVVISENHGFQSIRRLQMWRAGRDFGNEFRARRNGRLAEEYLQLDLAKAAEGLGARAFRADSPETLREALAEARSERGTCVIVCETEPHRYLPDSGAWWDVAPAEVSGDELVRKLRADYERERAELQRFYY
ncbi:MAG: 3D-(3,5/4)-trihydroxycyclohexane-1,2-dione acylhydrolase (decyclizing) [Actinomycetota bacterium]|nr:3D-(3,5/4)-trihydroxycyclohexane-1,2-dione acylhydrolase (decyclizing) [Actinomycetota bacterium]